MITNVIPFHTRMKAIETQQLIGAPSMYELYWSSGTKDCCVACSNRDQIVRQMESLAKRRIAATVYENGWPIGNVGPGPNARSGGRYQAYLYV